LCRPYPAEATIETRGEIKHTKKSRKKKKGREGCPDERG